MSLEVCKKCVDEQRKLYKCSKCSQTLCMHHYRTHKCSDPNLGLRGERSARLNASITKEAWDAHLKKTKSFKLEIRDDFSFIIDFPWFPFTQLKAWVPATRENYPEEETFPLNLDLVLEGLANKLAVNEYARKFESSKWLIGKLQGWRISWLETTNYWERPVTQRTTKFELMFPQFLQQDLHNLEKTGCNVILSPVAKKNMQYVLKTALQDISIKILYSLQSMVITWSEKADQWCRSLIEIFIDYMAIFYLESPNEWKWIVSINQDKPNEFSIPFWAKSRAFMFWKAAQEEMLQSKTPIVNIIIEHKPENLPPLKTIHPKSTYTLRPYQQKAIQTWNENFYFGSEQLPTGAGKTIIGIDAIYRSKTPTLILVPNLDLVEQWKSRIHTYLDIPYEHIGIFSGLRKTFEDYDIVISTYQLLSQYIKDYYLGIQLNESLTISPAENEQNSLLLSNTDDENGDDDQNGDKKDQELEFLPTPSKPLRDLAIVSKTLEIFRSRFGLLIADEAHHVKAETFKEIALHLEIPRRLALSATIEWEFNLGLIVATMGPKIYEVRYGLLSKQGYIAPIAYRLVKVRLSVEEQQKLMDKKASTQSFKSKLCRHSTNKLNAITEIVKAPFSEQILIFTSRVNHAKEIQAHLTSYHFNSTLLVGETVTNAKEREDILEKFRKKEIKILILVKMLNEGFDAPCDTVIICSGSKNQREHLQRIGRATRPGRVAKIYELIVDGQDLDYEEEIAQQRDIKNVIEPWVQDSLIDKTLLSQIDQLFKRFPDQFSLKS